MHIILQDSPFFHDLLDLTKKNVFIFAELFPRNDMCHFYETAGVSIGDYAYMMSIVKCV